MNRQEIFKRLMEIDPNVFNYGKIRKRKERDEKILRCAREYFSAHHMLAMPHTYEHEIKDENGVTIEKFPLGKNIAYMRYSMKGKGTHSFANELFSALESLDARVFDDFYFLEYRRAQYEAKVLKCLEIYYAKNKNLGIPLDEKITIVNDDGTKEEVNIGQIMSYFKVRVKTDGQTSFSQEFIDKVLAMDKNVLSVKNIYNAKRMKREEKLLMCFQAYFDENRNLAVPKNYKFPIIKDGKVVEYVNLGSVLENVRGFANGRANSTLYSESFIEELKKIDPRCFEKNYTVTLAREKKEKKILTYLKEYLKKNGHLAVPKRYMHEIRNEDGEVVEEYALGNEVRAIKTFAKGANATTNIYSQELLDEILKLDKRFFEENYAEHLAVEQREKFLLDEFKKYYKAHHNLAVPLRHEVKMANGEKYSLGRELTRIRTCINAGRPVIYSQEFIDSLKEIDPRVFETNYSMRKLKAEKVYVKSDAGQHTAYVALPPNAPAQDEKHMGQSKKSDDKGSFGD